MFTVSRNEARRIAEACQLAQASGHYTVTAAQYRRLRRILTATDMTVDADGDQIALLLALKFAAEEILEVATVRVERPEDWAHILA